MRDTKSRLLVAAAETLRESGIAGLSARTIAARADVNQALIFYHFNTVAELVDAAVRASVDARVDFYRDLLATVGSLTELLEAGRELHERETELGNVAMMAQLMAGAQQDKTLAAAARYAIDAWITEIETVLTRLLNGSPLAEVADPSGLARAVSASFIGLELYDGVDRDGASAALDALQRLGVLVEVMDDLGPVAHRALRRRVRRKGAHRTKACPQDGRIAGSAR
ncbi:MAG TPA: TetR/AcrR family transcriptional regulator [Jatrophihabitantaceae bacterium]|jgi:AcrR family transcriptional regulator|nr:TetR/AcrR family transcriptional regulator [Jatrophihabitantaceae bacterium]